MTSVVLKEFSWERMIAAVEDVRVPTLETLVRMKLTSFRLKDKVHLLDLLDVGLTDESWRGRLSAGLAERLTEIIQTRDVES